MIRRLGKLQPFVLLLLRLTVGVSMVYHSWDKVVPKGGFFHGHPLSAFEHFNDFVVTLHLPRWLGYVSTVTEFVGGLSVIVGLFTRFWGLMIAGNMIVAIVTVNSKGGYAGSEYSLALAVMALMLLVAGSGAWSLDRRFGFA